MKTRETITPTLDTKKVCVCVSVCVCVCVCQDIPLKVHRDSTENHSEVKKGVIESREGVETLNQFQNAP